MPGLVPRGLALASFLTGAVPVDAISVGPLPAAGVAVGFVVDAFAARPVTTPAGLTGFASAGFALAGFALVGLVGPGAFLAAVFAVSLFAVFLG